MAYACKVKTYIVQILNILPDCLMKIFFLMFALTTGFILKVNNNISLIGESLCLVSFSRLKAPRLSVSVSVSLQFWLLISLGLGLVRLFIFPEVSGLVSSQNIEKLKNLLRSRHVLVSVSRLKARDSRSRPGLGSLLIFKKSRSRTRPFVIFSRSLVLGLVAKYWSRRSVHWWTPHYPHPTPHIPLFPKAQARRDKCSPSSPSWPSLPTTLTVVTIHLVEDLPHSAPWTAISTHTPYYL